MRDRTPRDDSIYARPDDRPYESVVDLPVEATEKVRATRKHADGRLDDQADEVQRVGGRHRIRPELVIAILGPLFIVAALLKPWSAVQPPAHGSASPAAFPTSAIVARATEADAPSASLLPSPVGWPDIPPGDYRFPQENLPPLNATTGSAAVDAHGWAAVDWTLLYVVDQHDAWGLGTAVMPDQTDVPAGVPTATPDLSWVPAAAQPVSTEVNVGAGAEVFGINVTWPASVRVTGVRFTYLQGPGRASGMPPAGFLASAEVSPLSATVVAWAGVASPFGPSVPTPDSVGPVHTSDGTLRSGQFWIAPSGASPQVSATAPLSAVPTAWHSAPWQWPTGDYRVTIDTTTGVHALLFTIRQTA